MHPIENIMQTSIEQIKRMVDVNTVVGSPVSTENKTMILPVSKVSLGFLVGGGEYGKMASARKAACRCDEESETRFPFAGASAVGMSITPLAFVTVEEGNVRVLPAEQSCITDRLMDVVPQAMKCMEKVIKSGMDCLKNKCSCGEKNCDDGTENGKTSEYTVDTENQTENYQSQGCE